jgi:putative ABC transport system ATP-binding protein
MVNMLVETKGLKKIYHLGKTTVPALRGVDIKIKEGEFMAIVGPSGSGKTTLLNMIGAIDYPSAGTVHFEGQDITRFSDKEATDLRRNELGFIFQTFNLVPVLTAYENIELPLLMKQVPKQERKELVNDWLNKVGIAEYAKHRPEELSGGQRQRVSIARALIIKPKLVLADEPTANLDHTTGNSILTLMQQMNKDLGTTFIFSTHDPKVMEKAKQTVVLTDGKIT